MKKIAAACILLLTLTASSAYAKETSQFKSTVGFTAGVTTGLGLTYRGAYNDWFGQVGFMPAWNKENGGNIFAGTQFGKRIQGDDKFYLNVAIGLGVMYANGEDCDWVELPAVPGEQHPDGEEICTNYEDVYMAGGPSIGLGKVWGDHLHAEIYIPIAAVWKFGEGLDAVVPYPGITMGYRW